MGSISRIQVKDLAVMNLKVFKMRLVEQVMKLLVELHFSVNEWANKRA